MGVSSDRPASNNEYSLQFWDSLEFLRVPFLCIAFSLFFSQPASQVGDTFSARHSLHCTDTASIFLRGRILVTLQSCWHSFSVSHWPLDWCLLKYFAISCWVYAAISHCQPHISHYADDTLRCLYFDWVRLRHASDSSPYYCFRIFALLPDISLPFRISSAIFSFRMPPPAAVALIFASGGLRQARWFFVRAFAIFIFARLIFSCISIIDTDIIFSRRSSQPRGCGTYARSHAVRPAERRWSRRELSLQAAGERTTLPPYASSQSYGCKAERWPGATDIATQGRESRR